MSFQPPAGTPPPAPRRRPYRRPVPGLLLPALLIAAGVLALLLELGAVSADQLARAFELWPVALILLGVVLICQAWLPRFAAPLAVALAIVLVVGAVAYSAAPAVFGGASAEADYSAPLAGAQHGSLDVALAGSSVSVQGGDVADLYRAHVKYPAGHPPEVRADGGSVSLQTGSAGPFAVGGPRQADITLNRSLPWDVKVGGGASRSRLDLSDVQLLSLEVSGGAEQVEVSLSRPTGTVAVQVSGGASSITVHRPAGVAAHVRMSGGASNLTLDGDHRSVLGGDLSLESSDYASADARYDFEVSGGASSITIDRR